MSLKPIPILIYGFKKKIVTELLNVYQEIISKWCARTGYSSIMVPNEPYNEASVRVIHDVLSSTEVDAELVKKSKERVAIIQLRGFKEEDEPKIATLIDKALKEYKIDILVVNDPVNIISLDEFENRIAKDLTIFDEVKSTRSNVVPAPKKKRGRPKKNE